MIIINSTTPKIVRIKRVNIRKSLRTVPGTVYKCVIIFLIILISIMQPSSSLCLNWGQDLLTCFE